MTNRIAMAVGVLLVTDTFAAQYGSMMNGGNGGMWAGGSWVGGYGGICGLLLLVIAVAGLAVLIAGKKEE
jgi:hypothetical protein